jgi:anthranilate synthase component 1
LVGYTSYDAARFFEDVELKARPGEDTIPSVRYALYRTIIVFDHLRHSLHMVEQLLPGDTSDTRAVEAAILHRDVPAFRFVAEEKETASVSEEDFLRLVEKGIAHCRRGDVFQMVLSRRFTRKFSGDEFNVYRALRAINPSPYLFFADYGDYRIFGSSPEAQLVVRDGRAIVHPIAGTFRRSGNESSDRLLEAQLLADPKENAEHIMLVDLARNDLARAAADVRVEAFREVHRYSHVIHLVSKVSAAVGKETNLFRLLANTFPAGTLSGAPKIRAMQLIDALEPAGRNFYGGCIGLAGFDGTMNQAIMIRSFLSKNGALAYQAGAGIVVSSVPEKELKEIDNKLAALRKAIETAAQIHN